MASEQPIRLGELLIQKELITLDQLDTALKEQKRTGSFLGSTLMRLGLIRPDKLLPVLSDQLNIEYVSLKGLNISPEAIKNVPAKFAYHYKLIPLSWDGEELKIAVTDPYDVHTLDDVGLLLNCRVLPVLGEESDIMDALKKYYGVGAETVEAMMSDAPEKEHALDESVIAKTENIDDLAADASVIKFVNQILLQAYQERATDVHIEPFGEQLRVRYRIDGVMYETSVPQSIKHFQSAIISRIKIMSNLNISEKRLAQDGRTKIKMGNKELDLRISIIPTAFGESVNIRLLSSQDMLISLTSLGLSDRHLKSLNENIEKPHGIILVTGPTGSGKSTTLYACLKQLNQTTRKIITIEDPIEYLMSGISQIQVLPKIDLTFAQGLRSILRHDPDIIMVGEIRDYETAEISIRAALTGHLVFSTLHTNDAPGAVARLVDMGVEPYLVASSVECIIAQRLVRVICKECKQEVKIGRELLSRLSSEHSDEEITIFEGRGCDECKNTGYSGRIAIHEFLDVGEDIRDLIVKRKPSHMIRKVAIDRGMMPMRTDGWQKIKNGITSVEEVLRVTQEEGGI